MSVDAVLTDGTYKNEVYVTLNMINYVSINISMSRVMERKGIRCRICNVETVASFFF